MQKDSLIAMHNTNELKIHHKLIKALKDAGIDQLSGFQISAFNAISSDNDVLIIAPTGSGKTESALIPILDRMLKKEKIDGIYLLYITPLKALNRDMLRRFEKLSENLGFSVAVRHGDTLNSERKKQSKKPPQILITTPETFQILFQGNKLRKALSNVEYVVIDEIHEMVDSERGVQLSVGIERLRELADFRIVGLSATVRDEISNFLSPSVKVIRDEFEKEYRFQVIKSEVTEKDYELSKELNIIPEVSAEFRIIKEISEKHRSVLIFVNTRQTAEALGLKLKKLMDVEVHHGSLSREARIDAEKEFAEGKLKALICTSSMELGIDIGHVDAVIQFNSPREVARLLQRVGRSGHRKERVSQGYIIARTFDDIMESWIISYKALRNEIEKLKIHHESLDTLANQISAIALEYKRIDVKKVYSILKRSYPYRSLDFEKFLRICEFLAQGNVIFFDGDTIGVRRKTRHYFYENISMIPDERNYRVVDVTSGRTIGLLDESFLSTFSGEVFAMKGELWRVLSIDEFVRVEPVTKEGEIPSWVGEEIPVPFEVAIAVGRLRRELANLNREKAVQFIKNRFQTNDSAIETVLDVIDRQKKKKYEVPSDVLITIESSENVTVINCCFGHKVNETIGRVIALLLSARKGRNVGIEIDPYRIKLTPANCDEVAEILLSLHPDSIPELAKRSLMDTNLLQWKVIHSARKFGYLRKGSDISRINLRKLVIKLKDTPIFEEAIREIFTERLDIEKTKEIIKKTGKTIRIVKYDSLSPISLESREQAFDILATKPFSAILDVFKKRLENEMAVFHCINCNYTVRSPVKLIKELRCPRCNSSFIAVFNARRKLEDFSKSELYRIANLVLSHGRRAVLAMNTHGVGAENASRILSKYFRNEDEFYKELMEAEKRYIRTRGFWD